MKAYISNYIKKRQRKIEVKKRWEQLLKYKNKKRRQIRFYMDCNNEADSPYVHKYTFDGLLVRERK